MRFLIYASISPVVHLVAVGSRHDGNVESIANVTEVGMYVRATMRLPSSSPMDGA